MKDLPVPGFLKPYMPLIEGVVLTIVIFVVGWIVAKAVHRAVLRVLRSRKADESLSRFLAALAQYSVLAAAVIAALGSVGVETTSLVALLGSAGIAVGLALQGNLAHFASGVMLLMFRPFTIDDVVDAGGQSGAVVEIGLFATTLLTLENHRIIVPNGAITSGPITNYTALGQRRVTIDVGVAYGSGVDQVQAILLKAAQSVDLVLKDPEVVVAFVGLGASSLDFAVHVWTKNEDFFPIQHEVRKAVYDALNAAEVEIPFNQIVVHQAAEG